MKIAPFTPINTLLKAVKVSPTYVVQEEVLITADSFLSSSSIGNAYKFTFNAAQIRSMGTSPLVLDINASFIPVQASVIVYNDLTPFDFGAGDDFIIKLGTTTIFDSNTELQNLSSNRPFNIRLTPSTYNIEIPAVFTTKNAGDATDGDGNVDLYLFGYSTAIY